MSARAIFCVTAALAAAVPVVAAPAWAGGNKAEYCYTTLLSDAELEAGKVNAVSCYSSELLLTAAVDIKLGVPLDPLALLGLSFTNRRLARHYDSGTSGSNLSVYGTSCTGGGLNLNGTGWEDRISTTQHGACGTIVHYTDLNFGGSSQLTVGGCGGFAYLSPPVANNVSSIRYFAPESGWCWI